MKQKILILFIILIQSSFAFAANQALDALEMTIFGYDYKNENDSKRIERIETHLYGSKKSGNINKRIENIKNDIGYVKPQTMTKENNKNSLKNDLRNEFSNIKEDASVEYPMVDKIEEELFKTNYKTENIYTRLDRLEKQVFNKTSNEPLTDRVDRLASIVLPKKTFSRSEEDFSQQELDKYYRNNGLQEIDNQTLPFQLAVLEQDILKNNYENDNIANRLNRLETKLFNRTFTSDTDITRLQRILVAYDAKQKSHKYENNRRMQNMATASQISGILLMILAMIL